MHSVRNKFGLIIGGGMLLLASLACDAWATINGQVIDANGQPLPDAEITVLQGDRVIGTSRTGHAGQISVHENICPLIGCSPKITIRVSKLGYRTETRSYETDEEAVRMRRGIVIALVRE